MTSRSNGERVTGSGIMMSDLGDGCDVKRQGWGRGGVNYGLKCVTSFLDV